MRLPVHPRCTLIPFHLEPGVPDLLLRDPERLARCFQLVHATPPSSRRLTERTTATDDPAPSLRPRYRGFSTTTGRSASVPGDGTHVPTGHSRLGHSLSPHADAAVSGHAFSRSAREPQTRAHATSAPDTAWPVNGTPARLIPETHTIAPVLMSSERVTTLQQWSSSGSLPDASPCAFSSSLTTTVFSQRSMRRLEAAPRRAAPGGHQSPISRAAPHQETLHTYMAGSSLRS